MNLKKNFLVIFDMNGVLMSKNVRLNEFFSEVPIPTQSRTVQCLYPSIDLDLLAKFYSSHSFYIGLWTTVMEKNAKSPYKILCNLMGIDFDCFLTQENCSVGEMVGSIKTIYCIKDLRKPSLELDVELKNCVLIDDNEGKRCENQNFLLFDSSKRDIVRCIKEIDEFIGCTDENCLAKHL